MSLNKELPGQDKQNKGFKTSVGLRRKTNNVNIYHLARWEHAKMSREINDQNNSILFLF